MKIDPDVVVGDFVAVDGVVVGFWPSKPKAIIIIGDVVMEYSVVARTVKVNAHVTLCDTIACDNVEG